jgi:predicted phosphodiesterase
MVLPDLHIPHHDQGALSCVLHAYQFLKPDEVIVLGDWLDCEQFSSHGVQSMTELRAHRFIEDEVDPCRRVLDKLQKNNNRLVYVEGNHEQRIERWAASWGGRLGPDFYKLMAPRRLLGDDRKNFVWVPYADYLSHYEVTPALKNSTALWAVHGWSHSKQAAAAHLSKAISVSVVYGHTHRMQVETRRDPATGKILKSWSPGCLSKLQPLYRANNPTEWTHGFSLIYVGKNSWTDYNISIVNGKCVLPNGREIFA